MLSDFAGKQVDTWALHKTAEGLASARDLIPYPRIPYGMSIAEMPPGTKGWASPSALHGKRPLELASVRLNAAHTLRTNESGIQVARHLDGTYTVDLSRTPDYKVDGTIDSYSPD